MNEISLTLSFKRSESEVIKISSLAKILYSLENIFKSSLKLLSSGHFSLSISIFEYALLDRTTKVGLKFEFEKNLPLFEENFELLSSINSISTPNESKIDAFDLFYLFNGVDPSRVDMDKDIVKMYFKDAFYSCDAHVYKLYSSKEFAFYSKMLCRVLYKEGINSLRLESLDNIYFVLFDEKIRVIKNINISPENVRTEYYPSIKLRITKVSFPDSDTEMKGWGFYSEVFDFSFSALIRDSNFIYRVKDGESFCINEYLICSLKKEASLKGKNETNVFYIEKVIKHIKKDFQISLFLD